MKIERDVLAGIGVAAAVVVALHARPYAQRAEAAGKDVLVIVGVVIVTVVLLIVVVAGAQGAQRRPQRPQIKAAANGAVIGVILQQTIANLRFLLIDPYAAEAAGNAALTLLTKLRERSDAAIFCRLI